MSTNSCCGVDCLFKLCSPFGVYSRFVESLNNPTKYKFDIIFWENNPEKAKTTMLELLDKMNQSDKEQALKLLDPQKFDFNSVFLKLN